MKKIGVVYFLAFFCSLFLFTGCKEKEIDFHNPDVKVFVKQLKAGKYKTLSPEGFVEVPKFKEEDIPKLLKYADDLTIIPTFPLPPVSSYVAGGTIRLGESLLWIVEYIRLGHYPSLGCKMVRANADDYEGIYFLTDEEVLDAVAHYRRWWETRSETKSYWTIDPCFDDPLCGSGYRWW